MSTTSLKVDAKYVKWHCDMRYDTATTWCENATKISAWLKNVPIHLCIYISWWLVIFLNTPVNTWHTKLNYFQWESQHKTLQHNIKMWHWIVECWVALSSVATRYQMSHHMSYVEPQGWYPTMRSDIALTRSDITTWYDTRQC